MEGVKHKANLSPEFGSRHPSLAASGLLIHGSIAPELFELLTHIKIPVLKAAVSRAAITYVPSTLRLTLYLSFS